MIVLLPRTSLLDANSLAERLRSAVAQLAIPHENRPDPTTFVTVSAGVLLESGNGCDDMRGSRRSEPSSGGREGVGPKSASRRAIEAGQTPFTSSGCRPGATLRRSPRSRVPAIGMMRG